MQCSCRLVLHGLMVRVRNSNRSLCRQHVTLEDLKDFLPPDKAAAALATLDVDHDGTVSLHDMRDAVLQVRIKHECLQRVHSARLHGNLVTARSNGASVMNGCRSSRVIEAAS